MRQLIKIQLLTLLILSFFSSCSKNGEYTVKILSLGDIHGNFFDTTYVENTPKPYSMSNVSYYVSKQREQFGKDNLLLIDMGDDFQGDDCCYYYNYIDTTIKPHFIPRILNFMEFDVAIPGNHDIEQGAKVYDALKKDLKCDYLAANAIDSITHKPYFKPYSIINKGGIKIAVIGMTNPKNSVWVVKDIVKGLHFKELYPLCDSLVQLVNKKERPDLTVLAVHAGIVMDGSYVSENSGKYLAEHIKGVDIVISAHDHQARNMKVYNGQDSVLLINSGPYASYVSDINVKLTIKGSKVIKKEIDAENVSMADFPPDKAYNDFFREDFLRVKTHANKNMGYLKRDIILSDALKGSSEYISTIHLIHLKFSGAEISFASPFNIKDTIPAGVLHFHDLYKIYPYKNYLYTLKMTGKEIKDYLEISYDYWVNNNGIYYYYDSAGGINYDVKVSAPKGKRIIIKSMANGSDFSESKEYIVAMTSYRACGAGGLLEAIGITSEQANKRLINKFPEVRTMLFDFISSKKEINLDCISYTTIVGAWSFIK